MTILRPTPVSSDLFSLHLGRETLFVAELSDLGRGLERVYDDAADVGLTLVSARTGREVVCRVAREERDREGELVMTVLEPADPKERRLFSVCLLAD